MEGEINVEAQDLLNYKNWAVAGDVLNSSKYAYRIVNSLIQAGFNAQGVNPRDETGTVYKSLKEVSGGIEVLDLCIHPLKGIGIVKEAHELNIDNILIQPGAESQEILEYCRTNGMTAIEGCALVELFYRRARG